MPDPKKLLKTLELARQNTLAAEGRVGHFIELTAVEEVFVIGDLHGNISNFQTLYKQMELNKYPNRQMVLQELIHGRNRYPGGGEKSHQLIDLFAALKCQNPRQVHYLIGNHELAQWFQKPIMKNDEDLNVLFDEGVQQAYYSYAEEIMQAYFDLFEACPLGIRLPNRVYLSHTLPHAKYMDRFSLDFVKQEEYEPADYQAGGLIHSNLWGRDVGEENVREFLARVDCDFLICGHIPCDEGFAFPCERLLVMDCARIPGGYARVDAKKTYDVESFRQIAMRLE